MTIRLVVDGRGAARRRIVERLAERSGGRVQIACHLGEPDADLIGPALNRMRAGGGRQADPMTGLQSRGAALPLLTSSDYQAKLQTAIDQLHRSDPTYRYRSHNLRNLQDYLDYYHILAETFAQKVGDTGATHALFMNVPHVGYDTIMYHVARALGLKTLVLCQTIFSDRYFSMEAIEHLGLFDAHGSDAPPMAIEKGTSPDLFYMDPRWQTPSPRGRISTAAILRFLKHVAFRRPGSLVNPVYLTRTLRRIANVYRSLPDWRDPFARFFHDNELAYFEHLAGYEGKSVDLDAEFVYIPLHNQPELSTSALGGVWRDQLLMIEAVAAQLPDGWKIYVKENPRQGAFARGPFFFHRLGRIRGVTLVPSTTSTHALSTRARLTATITGTAGWEAMRKGRPALVFGAAWYRSLPGAIIWRPGLDLEALSRLTFAHEALEADAGALMARCHPGVLEFVYQKIVRDYDAPANTETVSATILDLLEGRLPLTFSTT